MLLLELAGEFNKISFVSRRFWNSQVYLFIYFFEYFLKTITGKSVLM